MNTSKLADVSEIVSSIAVVITLVFLTLQMQQNTQAIQASTRQAALEADTNVLIELMNHPAIALNRSKPELTDEEIEQLITHLVIVFRLRENDFAQFQNGVMDKVTWERYLSSISSFLRYERVRNWWQNIGTVGYSPDFVKLINNMLVETPVRNIQRAALNRASFESPEEYRKVIDSLIQN